MGQSKYDEKLRILIDASKDGGLWWFPQGQPFDAEQYHQGKAFADSLRGDGAEVIELPRGETITAEKLSSADLVITVPAFFPYSADEAIAYRESVAAGTKLLLIGGSTQYENAVAKIFGLRFEQRTSFASVQRWAKHPFTANIVGDCALPWSTVVAAPKEALFLAWLNRRKETPVLGYLPSGKGYVVFVGQTLFFRPPEDSFSKNLISVMNRTSLEALKDVPAVEVFLAEAAAGIAPRLIEPVSESVLSQPGQGEWRFDWEDVPGAESYEIVILGPAASFALVQTTTNESEYTVGSRKSEEGIGIRKGSYVAGPNLRGWSWRVRAQYSNGKWGPWSRERRFNISPLKEFLTMDNLTAFFGGDRH